MAAILPDMTCLYMTEIAIPHVQREESEEHSTHGEISKLHVTPARRRPWDTWHLMIVAKCSDRLSFNMITGEQLNMVTRFTRLLAALLLTAVIAGCAPIVATPVENVGAVNSADGSLIRYGVRGQGETTLVFIHCWTCNHEFWKPQIEYFANAHRVIWLDLAGHGSSASNRDNYTMQAFGADVAAVVSRVGGGRIVLVGHSMGGPVAIEAAKLLGDSVIGIVGVDTFQTSFEWPTEDARIRQFVQPFEVDFKGSSEKMVRSMFPPGADPAVVSWVLGQMVPGNEKMGVSAMYSIFKWNAGEGPESLKRYAGVLRNINGAPTGTEEPRDASVTLVSGTGHFIAQEKPVEFNRILAGIIADFQTR